MNHRTERVEPVTVAELIEFLKTQPQDLLVAYECFSEQALIRLDEIKIKSFCPPRDDGWIQNARDDKPSQPYLIFPGN